VKEAQQVRQATAGAAFTKNAWHWARSTNVVQNTNTLLLFLLLLQPLVHVKYLSCVQ
jgi:hypothetical protein